MSTSIFKNYASTIYLLIGIVVGALVGLYFPALMPYISPVGDIYLNFLLTLIVPLIFCSITLAIYNLCKQKMVGKVLITAFIVFLLMSLVITILGYFGCLIYNPLEGFTEEKSFTTFEDLNLGKQVVNAVSVSDFLLLFNRSRLLALIIFSAFLGVTLSMIGEKGEKLAGAFDLGNTIVMKMMDLIIVLAPLGMGCYFAGIIADLGDQILGGYLRTFVLYSIIALVIYFVVNPIYIYFVSGFSGVKTFFKNILQPSLTAIATCSSAACIPISINSCKAMGASDTVTDTLIPLGTNVHKDGSVLACVFKTLFVVVLTGMSISDPSTGLIIIAVSVVAAVVVGAVPGGAMTGEVLICTLLGVQDPQMVGILLIIATIIDIPATVLNVIGNVTANSIVDKIVKKKS